MPEPPDLALDFVPGLLWDDRVALFGTCQKVRSMALLVGMNGVAFGFSR